MNKRKPKLIDLYKHWMEIKVLPGHGLCNSIPVKYDKFLNLFAPNLKEGALMDEKGECTIYWGSGLRAYNPKIEQSFTPLRQTIVLFICAMNNEI